MLPASRAAAIPTGWGETGSCLVTASASEWAWTLLPTLSAATTAKKENRIASPFWCRICSITYMGPPFAVPSGPRTRYRAERKHSA